VYANYAKQNSVLDENTWTTTGPYGVKITGLAIDPFNNQIIFASSPDGAVQVYKSIDGGETWFASDTGLEDGFGEIFNFAFDPLQPGTIYVASQGGIYKSSDYGRNWERKSLYDNNGTSYQIRAWSISCSPIDGTLYVGAYASTVGSIGGIFRSKTGGDSWELVADSIKTDSIIKAIMVAPSAPHIIYAGGYSGGIFKSIDRGDTWQRSDSSFGIPPAVFAIEVDPYDAQIVYISTNSGIYKSMNGGQSWVPIGTGLNTTNITGIAIDPGNQQVIYVGGENGIPGVYRSLDSLGLSWQAMMNGMGSRSVYSIAINDDVNQTVYAGTQSGIWKYSIASETLDYSISINDGALFVNNDDVTLSLTAPSGTTEMLISNDGGFADVTWEPYSNSKIWTISSYGDYVIPRTVYAKFKTYGQISGLYQDDIVLDTIAPSGTVQIVDNDKRPNLITNFSLNNEFAYLIYLPAIMRDARFGYNLVRLNLSATDDFSGIGDMIISNDSSFTESEWETYNQQKEWWIHKENQERIYVKFRDRAGNVSAITSTTVP
jgi:photosystem II stability/assembly factor-like uncharacterized protein